MSAPHYPGGYPEGDAVSKGRLKPGTATACPAHDMPAPVAAASLHVLGAKDDGGKPLAALVLSDFWPALWARISGPVPQAPPDAAGPDAGILTQLLQCVVEDYPMEAVRVAERMFPMQTATGVDSYLRRHVGMLNAVIGVGTFGARKYTPRGWRYAPEGKDRYKNALARHVVHILEGEDIDRESGHPHKAHIAWNALAWATLNIIGPADKIGDV